MREFLKGKERYAAEFLGTYFLVLCGCGTAAAAGRFSSFGSGPLGVALAFGMVVMVLVFTLGPFSGAHFNPAVSLGFFSVGKLSRQELGKYAAAQVAGAILASLSLKVLMNPPSLGETGFALLPLQAWSAEFLATFLLMFVIMAVAADEGLHGLLAGLAVGGAILACSLWCGPLTGSSMNPARSLGPALVSGDWGGLWVYLSAPFAGAVAAAQFYRALKGTA